MPDAVQPPAGANLGDTRGSIGVVGTTSVVGVVGAGRGATLHIEAVNMLPSLELAGIAASSPMSPHAAALAGALDCAVLPLHELAQACDLVLVAVPPNQNEQVLTELAASRRVRAVLVESPVATTLADADLLRAVMAPRPVLTGANLLHAPAVRSLLDAIATMNPTHLELRLAAPTPPRRAPASFGGGVLLNPTAGLWPVLLAALSSQVTSVQVTRLDHHKGIDHRADLVLHTSDGRTATAVLETGAQIAQASIEAADSSHVARTEFWPETATEIDGVELAPPSLGRESADKLHALGFTTQLQRLDRVSQGQSPPWPDLAVGSAAVTIALAAAVSATRGGDPVSTRDLPLNLSPFDLLTSPST